MKVQYYDYIEKVVMQWFLKSVCKKYKVNSYKIWIWSLLQVLTIIFVNWNENSILKLQRIVIPWIFKGIFFSLFCFIVRVNYAFRILNFIWDPQENGLSFFFQKSVKDTKDETFPTLFADDCSCDNCLARISKYQFYDLILEKLESFLCLKIDRR